MTEKIWIIGRGYPTAANNRLGNFELEQARILAKAGMDVTYLVTDLHSIRRRRPLGYLTRMEEGVSIATASIPLGGLVPPRMMGRLGYSQLGQLMKVLEKRSGRPDIIHVHYMSTLPYRFLVPWQKKGVKIVWTEHWSKVQDKTISEEQKENLKQYAENADAVCCVGSSLERSIREMTGTERPIHIIPNVLYGEFRPRSEHHEGFRFVSIGRMVAVKQYDLLARAFLEAFKGRPEVTLTMTGSGPEFEKIAGIVRDADAGRQILLTGQLPHEKIAGLLASSDAFVGFSELETFCVPAVEAWSCGKPVITTTTTTVFADHPDERLGIMVPPDSPGQLKEAMQRMVSEYDRYDPAWISEYADTHFSERVFLEKMLALYEELCQPTGGCS